MLEPSVIPSAGGAHAGYPVRRGLCDWFEMACARLATFATMFPLWNERTETSVPRNAQCVQLSAAAALNCLKNHDAGRERHER
jgi:hypothetical protein